jgi:hypothetical protein
LHSGVDSGHRTTEADDRLIFGDSHEAGHEPGIRHIGDDNEHRLAGAQGFSTSGVGSTGISKSNAPVAITKVRPRARARADRPPLAAHHHSGATTTACCSAAAVASSCWLRCAIFLAVSHFECILKAIGRRRSRLVQSRPLLRGVFQFTRGPLLGKTRRRVSFKENSLTVVDLLWRCSSACTRLASSPASQASSCEAATLSPSRPNGLAPALRPRSPAPLHSIDSVASVR